MVFILEYKIHYMDLATGKVTVPQISVADNNVDVMRRFEDVAPSRVAVSPDGKKFALAVRGLLYISDVEGKYQQKLATPAAERVDEIVWGKDNNTLYYTRTDKGFTVLYTIKADGSSAERRLYRQECNIKVGSLVTAVRNDLLRGRLEDMFHDRTGAEVHLEEKVDPDLVGGFVFELDGYRLDASVANHLERLRRQLIEKNNRIV